MYTFVHTSLCKLLDMGWLRLVGNLKLQVSIAKEPYKRDYILQKRPIILRSLLIVATAYMYIWGMCMYMYKYGLQFTCAYTHMYKQLAGERRSEYGCACSHAYVYTHSRIHIHTCKHTHTYTYLYVCRQLAGVCGCLCGRAHVRAHVYLHIFMYMCIDMYLCYMCVYICLCTCTMFLYV